MNIISREGMSFCSLSIFMYTLQNSAGIQSITTRFKRLLQLAFTQFRTLFTPFDVTRCSLLVKNMVSVLTRLRVHSYRINSRKFKIIE
jgi:hypothetical protein